MACAGFGAVTFTVKAVRKKDLSEVDGGTVALERQITCGFKPRARVLAFTLIPGHWLDIQLVPDANAAGRAAAAYELARA